MLARSLLVRAFPYEPHELEMLICSAVSIVRRVRHLLTMLATRHAYTNRPAYYQCVPQATEATAFIMFASEAAAPKSDKPGITDKTVQTRHEMCTLTAAHSLQRHEVNMYGKCRGTCPRCLCCSSIQARNLVPKRSAFASSRWRIERKRGKALA